MEYLVDKDNYINVIEKELALKKRRKDMPIDERARHLREK